MRASPFLRRSFLAAAALAAGCSVPPVPPEGGPHMPFHVAVIPASVQTERVEEEGIAMELDRRQLDAAVASALDTSTFARASLLRTPGPGADPSWRNWSEEEWAAYWEESARAAGADLLMDTRLAHGGVDSRANGRVWFELPLFFLGGPFCWWVADRTYEADVRVDASFRPVRQLESAAPAEPVPLVSVSATAPPVDLDFVDRAGRDVGSYATTLIIPPGFLEGEEDVLEEKLGERFALEAAFALARRIEAGARELFATPGEHGFYLDPASRMLRDGASVIFVGQARLQVGAVERLSEMRLSADGAPYGARFTEPLIDEEHSSEDEKWVRYPFQLRMPAAPEVEYVKVELVGEGPEPRPSRSYTFVLR